MGISGLHEFTFAQDDFDRVVALAKLDEPFAHPEFLLLLENINGDVTRENFYELRDVLEKLEKDNPQLQGVNQMLPSEGLIGYWGFSVKSCDQLKRLLDKAAAIDQAALEIAAEQRYLQVFSLPDQSALVPGAVRHLLSGFRTLEKNFQTAVSSNRGHASLVA